MKFTPEVVAALEVLRAAAETPLEVATVDRCEKDLRELPTVEIVGNDLQIFDGVVFHKLPSGYYQGQVKMHRYVWERLFGKIPDGYVVHHKDRNPENNDIANLQALSADDHIKAHSQDMLSARQPQEFTCDCCGKTFLALSNGANRYCSKACQKKYRQRGESYQKENICVVCGEKFTVRKDKRTKTCSPECLSELRRRTHVTVPQTVTRTCVICGKEFVTNKHKHAQTCSSKCSHVLQWQKRKNQLANSDEK